MNAQIWQFKIYSEVNDVVLMSKLLTSNIFHNFFYCSIVDFEQLNVYWFLEAFIIFSRYFKVTWKQEAVAGRCSITVMFVTVSQNSQENTSVRVSLLMKLKARKATILQNICERIERR